MCVKTCRNVGQLFVDKNFEDHFNPLRPLSDSLLVLPNIQKRKTSEILEIIQLRIFLFLNKTIWSCMETIGANNKGSSRKRR